MRRRGWLLGACVLDLGMRPRRECASPIPVPHDALLCSLAHAGDSTRRYTRHTEMSYDTTRRSHRSHPAGAARTMKRLQQPLGHRLLSWLTFLTVTLLTTLQANGVSLTNSTGDSTASDLTAAFACSNNCIRLEMDLTRPPLFVQRYTNSSPDAFQTESFWLGYVYPGAILQFPVYAVSSYSTPIVLDRERMELKVEHDLQEQDGEEEPLWQLAEMIPSIVRDELTMNRGRQDALSWQTKYHAESKLKRNRMFSFTLDDSKPLQPNVRQQIGIMTVRVPLPVVPVDVRGTNLFHTMRWLSSEHRSPFAYLQCLAYDWMKETALMFEGLMRAGSTRIQAHRAIEMHMTPELRLNTRMLESVSFPFFPYIPQMLMETIELTLADVIALTKAQNLWRQIAKPIDGRPRPHARQLFNQSVSFQATMKTDTTETGAAAVGEEEDDTDGEDDEEDLLFHPGHFNFTGLFVPRPPLIAGYYDEANTSYSSSVHPIGLPPGDDHTNSPSPPGSHPNRIDFGIVEVGTHRDLRINFAHPYAFALEYLPSIKSGKQARYGNVEHVDTDSLASTSSSSSSSSLGDLDSDDSSEDDVRMRPILLQEVGMIKRYTFEAPSDDPAEAHRKPPKLNQNADGKHNPFKVELVTQTEAEKHPRQYEFPPEVRILPFEHQAMSEVNHTGPASPYGFYRITFEPRSPGRYQSVLVLRTNLTRVELLLVRGHAVRGSVMFHWSSHTYVTTLFRLPHITKRREEIFHPIGALVGTHTLATSAAFTLIQNHTSEGQVVIGSHRDSDVPYVTLNATEFYYVWNRLTESNITDWVTLSADHSQVVLRDPSSIDPSTWPYWRAREYLQLENNGQVPLTLVGLSVGPQLTMSQGRSRANINATRTFPKDHQNVCDGEPEWSNINKFWMVECNLLPARMRPQEFFMVELEYPMRADLLPELRERRLFLHAHTTAGIFSLLLELELPMVLRQHMRLSPAMIAAAKAAKAAHAAKVELAKGDSVKLERKKQPQPEKKPETPQKHTPTRNYTPNRTSPPTRVEIAPSLNLLGYLVTALLLLSTAILILQSWRKVNVFGWPAKLRAKLSRRRPIVQVDSDPEEEEEEPQAAVSSKAGKKKGGGKKKGKNATPHSSTSAQSSAGKAAAPSESKEDGEPVPSEDDDDLVGSKKKKSRNGHLSVALESKSPPVQPSSSPSNGSSSSSSNSGGLTPEELSRLSGVHHQPRESPTRRSLPLVFPNVVQSAGDAGSRIRPSELDRATMSPQMRLLSFGSNRDLNSATDTTSGSKPATPIPGQPTATSSPTPILIPSAVPLTPSKQPASTNQDTRVRKKAAAQSAQASPEASAESSSREASPAASAPDSTEDNVDVWPVHEVAAPVKPRRRSATMPEAPAAKKEPEPEPEVAVAAKPLPAQPRNISSRPKKSHRPAVFIPPTNVASTIAVIAAAPAPVAAPVTISKRPEIRMLDSIEVQRAAVVASLHRSSSAPFRQQASASPPVAQTVVNPTADDATSRSIFQSQLSPLGQGGPMPPTSPNRVPPAARHQQQHPAHRPSGSPPPAFVSSATQPPAGMQHTTLYAPPARSPVSGPPAPNPMFPVRSGSHPTTFPEARDAHVRQLQVVAQLQQQQLALLQLQHQQQQQQLPPQPIRTNSAVSAYEQDRRNQQTAYQLASVFKQQQQQQQQQQASYSSYPSSQAPSAASPYSGSYNRYGGGANPNERLLDLLPSLSSLSKPTPAGATMPVAPPALSPTDPFASRSSLSGPSTAAGRDHLVLAPGGAGTNVFGTLGAFNPAMSPSSSNGVSGANSSQTSPRGGGSSGFRAPTSSAAAAEEDEFRNFPPTWDGYDEEEEAEDLALLSRYGADPNRSRSHLDVTGEMNSQSPNLLSRRFEGQGDESQLFTTPPLPSFLAREISEETRKDAAQ
jgi:hypothetical protein